jgi:hypothetical protein
MNRVRGEIDEFIHVGRLFENPTIRGLAVYLGREHAEAIGRLDASAPPPRDESIRPAADAEALDRLESMSDTEVDSMLEALLAEQEGSE